MSSKVAISQICYANKIKDQNGEDVFIHVYPHKVALSLFDVENIYPVEVREVRAGEKSRYWAWSENYSKKPYKFIWPSKEDVIMCVPDYKKREGRNEGILVNVIVEMWNKI